MMATTAFRFSHDEWNMIRYAENQMCCEAIDAIWQGNCFVIIGVTGQRYLFDRPMDKMKDYYDYPRDLRYQKDYTIDPPQIEVKKQTCPSCKGAVHVSKMWYGMCDVETEKFWKRAGKVQRNKQIQNAR